MAHQPSQVKSELSIRNNGSIYLGIKSREALGVEYGDKVRATIPVEDGEDITVEGYLDSGSIIECRTELYRYFSGNPGRNGGRSVQVDAIVEEVARSWEESHDLTDERWDGYSTLKCSL